MVQKFLIKKGNIFESKYDIIVNPTNSIGVMGKGLAAKFKEEFPVECEEYNKLSKEYQKKRQHPVLMYPIIFDTTPYNILMFPTKIHWKYPSEMRFIETGLDACKTLLKNYREPLSIAFPMLGCGLGGLKKKEVARLIYQKFSDYEGLVELYHE